MSSTTFRSQSYYPSISTWWTSTIGEALPGVLRNRGNRAFISGEQGNKGQILRGTEEQRQYWGTGNIRKQIFDFWGTGEQANLFQGNKGTGTPPPGRASPGCSTTFRSQSYYPSISTWCSSQLIHCLLLLPLLVYNVLGPCFVVQYSLCPF